MEVGLGLIGTQSVRKAASLPIAVVSQRLSGLFVKKSTFRLCVYEAHDALARSELVITTVTYKLPIRSTHPQFGWVGGGEGGGGGGCRSILKTLTPFQT